MPEDANPPRSRQILVVEDEPMIRMMAADMLERLGYAVLEAGDGTEALAIIRRPEDPIAAMMIDLGLPDRPGEEVIRLALELRPGMSVIVTTGSDTVTAGERLGDCNILGFLEKPYYFNDLKAVIAPLSAEV